MVCLALGRPSSHVKRVGTGSSYCVRVPILDLMHHRLLREEGFFIVSKLRRNDGRDGSSERVRKSRPVFNQQSQVIRCNNCTGFRTTLHRKRRFFRGLRVPFESSILHPAILRGIAVRRKPLQRRGFFVRGPIGLRGVLRNGRGAFCSAALVEVTPIVDQPPSPKVRRITGNALGDSLRSIPPSGLATHHRCVPTMPREPAASAMRRSPWNVTLS